MKARPVIIGVLDGGGYQDCSPDEATHVILHFPGPIRERIIGVGSHGWVWNQDVDQPTISPSLKTTYDHPDGYEFVCHSFVRDGIVEFLSDCTHELAGQNVELLEQEIIS